MHQLLLVVLCAATEITDEAACGHCGHQALQHAPPCNIFHQLTELCKAAKPLLMDKADM